MEWKGIFAVKYLDYESNTSLPPFKHTPELLVLLCSKICMIIVFRKFPSLKKNRKTSKLLVLYPTAD